MNALKILLRIRNPSSLISRSYATTKKKIPNPQEEHQLPIFQYTVSKRTDRRVYVWGLAETGALGIHMPRGGKRGKKAYKNNFSLAWYPMRSTFGEKFDVTEIACGYGFTVSSVNTSELHKVFGTGINTDSQIGYHAPRIGHPLELLLSPAPIYIPYKSLETKVIGLAAGRAHSVILTDTEGAYTLGNNAYGQCGRKINSNEEYKGSMVSFNIRSLDKEKITSVCCGQDHTLFVTESGRVFACGWGADGQTGLGSYENQSAPAPVQGDVTSERVVKVASTGDCVLALSEAGELFGWGNSEYGQVPMARAQQQVNMSYSLLGLTRGLGRLVDVASGGSYCLIVNGMNSEYGRVPMARAQQQVNMSYSLLGLTRGLGRLVDVASGGSYCLIVNGMNSEYGRVPMARAQQQVNMSYSLLGLTRGLGRLVDVASGGSYCLIVNGMNSEYGRVPMARAQQQVNMSYSLLGLTRGLGRLVDVASGGSYCLIVNGMNSEYGRVPMARAQQQVNMSYSLLGLTRGLGRLVDVASGGSYCLIVNGMNSEYGRVPMARAQQQVNMSYSLLGLTRGLGRLVDVASGGSYCLIVNEHGDVFVWGYGLLGLGPNATHSSKPKQIPPALFGRNEFNPECMVKQVACGIGHLAAITNNGDLYMWGRNRHGCLGLGSAKDQHFPMKVAVGAHVLKVACGVDHTIALTKPFV